MWEDTWGELVPGTESGIRLYLSELMEIVCPALEAQSWPIKAQGAAAIATIAEKMGKGLLASLPYNLSSWTKSQRVPLCEPSSSSGGSLGPSHLVTFLNTLLGALQGRTWEGKVRCVCVCGGGSLHCKLAGREVEMEE